MNLIENKIDFEKMLKKFNIHNRHTNPQKHIKHLMMWAEYQYGKTLKELANDYDLTVKRTREIVDYVAPYKIRKMKKYVKLVA